MDSEKAPTGDFPGGIGDEPEEWRHHGFLVGSSGAIEARFVGHHRSIGDPAGDQNIDRDGGAAEVLRHDRAERLERCLGWAVGRGAGIKHRAEACRDVDDPTSALAHHLGHDRIRERQGCRRVHRDIPAPLIGRDLPELEGALPAIRPDGARADPGVVDEDVDAAEPGSHGLGDLVGCRVVGQVRLNGEQLRRFALLTRACCEGL
jgi:hypothetical protein